MPEHQSIGIGRWIAAWDARVANGEAIKVRFPEGGVDYRLTEKGIEEERKRVEPYRQEALQQVRDLALTDPAEAARRRATHLHVGLYGLDEQPEIPGYPKQTERSPRPTERKTAAKKRKSGKVAARIIT